jgi:hypothetical protein
MWWLRRQRRCADCGATSVIVPPGEYPVIIQ